MFKRQDVSMNNTGTDVVQSQDITKSSSSTSSSSSDSVRRSQMVLATDITQGLISEVRKLQSNLQEKDQIIKELEISQADINKENILIQKHLKQKDEIEEKLKEENWNLEVTNQDLQERLTDLSQTISKLNAEHTKVLKQLRNSTEQIEIFKAQDEKAKSTMEAMKARYDHEQQVLRRNNGNLQREMEQLKKTMSDLNTELKIQRAKLAIKSTVDNNVNQQQQQSTHNVSLEFSNDNDVLETTKEMADQQGVNDINNLSSSKTKHWALEVDTLKQSLSHAHRTISILRSNLHKEKLEKMEFKKMLADTQEQVEQLQKDIEQRSNSNRVSKKKSSGKSTTTTTSRKRVGGLKKKTSKISLLKSRNSESSNQQLDESITEEGQIEIRDDTVSDSNITSDEDELSSQNGSIDDDFFAAGGEPLSLELSGHSLGMELQMGGFMGSSFKPLSNELNESMSKPQTFDKGINTENDWILTDNKHQVINNVSIIPEIQSNEEQQEQELSYTKTSCSIESAAYSSTPSPATIITQTVAIVNSDESVKNSNSIHAETSTISIDDTPTHVSPTTKISVDQQRGKVSDMGQYHTSAHSQAPFTVQKNNDHALDVNKNLVHDGTADDNISSNEINVLKNANRQYQMTKSGIPCSEKLSTISGSEIKHIKFKEQLPSSSSSSSSSLPNTIKNNSVVDDVLNNNNNNNNNVLENSDHSYVNDKQDKNDLHNDITIGKSLADEIFNATKEASSYSIDKPSEVERSSIKIHDKIKMADQQREQYKNDVQNTIETVQYIQRTTDQANEDYDEQFYQQIEDGENSQGSIQHIKITKSEKPILQQDDYKKEDIKQEDIKQEDIKQDNVGQDDFKQDDVNQENIKQNIIQQDDNVHENVKQVIIKGENKKQENKQENIKQEKNRQENIIHQDEIKENIIRQDDIKENYINQGIIQQEITNSVKGSQIIHTINQHDVAFAIEQKMTQQKKEYEHHEENNENSNTTNVYIDKNITEEGFDLDSMTSQDMISREEAKALIKMAIADALAKERLEAAARRRESEADFISRSEAETLSKLRVDEALKKERERLSKVIQKKHSIISLKQLKDKENNNNNNKVDESVDDTFEKSHQTQKSLQINRTSTSSQDNQSIVETSNLAKRALAHRTSIKNLSPTPQPSTSASSTNTQTSSPPPSRLGLFSGLSKLQPSLSTPPKSSRSMRPSVSSSSLRRATRPKNSIASPSTSPSSAATETDTEKRKSVMTSTSPLKKTNSMDAAQHLSPLSAEAFGNVRITEKSTYTYKRPTGSNQEMLSKQPSIQSLVSMASSMHDRAGNYSLSNSTDEKLQLNNDLVSAITQTMIGEWMWKYTRRHVGNGISENKHKRFFWLHPFARTLYWNTVEPGVESKEVRAKSAFIESVSSIPNHENTDGCPFSLLIKTSKRDLKITATNLERHEIWRFALSFLILPENYEDTVGNVVNNSVILSTSKMPSSTVTLLTTASTTTHEETDEIKHKNETTDLEDAYDSDDSFNVHNADYHDIPKSST